MLTPEYYLGALPENEKKRFSIPQNVEKTIREDTLYTIQTIEVTEAGKYSMRMTELTGTGSLTLNHITISSKQPITKDDLDVSNQILPLGKLNDGDDYNSYQFQLFVAGDVSSAFRLTSNITLVISPTVFSE